MGSSIPDWRGKNGFEMPFADVQGGVWFIVFLVAIAPNVQLTGPFSTR